MFGTQIVKAFSNILPEIPETPEEFMIPINDINEKNDDVNDKLKDVIICEPDMILIDQSCQDEVKKIEDEDDGYIEVPPPTNQTDFSEDPPTKQICDQLDLACGSEIMNLKTIVSKIDSQGNKTEIIETFGIPSLEFLADPTDFDFKDGFLELKLELNTKRDVSITSTGLFNVFLNKESIFDEPIILSGKGISDENGSLQINFVSPTGIPSNLYIFNFGANFDKFINEQINNLELRVLNLDVQRIGDNFSLINQTIISLDIERDDIKIIIFDEELGETTRVYPTDSRIIVDSIPFKVLSWYCVGVFDGTLSADIKPSSIGVTCYDQNIIPRPIVGTNSAPQLGLIEVFDENQELFVRSVGGSGLGVLDELLTRNANYTMNLTFPIGSADLIYGKSQETKKFQCWQEADKFTWKTTSKRIVKAGGSSSTTFKSGVSSFTLGDVKCNLP